MKYQYKTAIGKIVIEVDEQLYNILDALDREERNADRRYSHHNPISLSSADYEGEWMKDDTDVLGDLVRAEDCERLYKTLAQLTHDQQKLLGRIVRNNEKIVEIAQVLGVSHQAISQQLMTVRKKLKKIFETALHFGFFDAI